LIAQTSTRFIGRDRKRSEKRKKFSRYITEELDLLKSKKTRKKHRFLIDRTNVLQSAYSIEDRTSALPDIKRVEYEKRKRNACVLKYKEDRIGAFTRYKASAIQ